MPLPQSHNPAWKKVAVQELRDAVGSVSYAMLKLNYIKDSRLDRARAIRNQLEALANNIELDFSDNPSV